MLNDEFWYNLKMGSFPAPKFLNNGPVICHESVKIEQTHFYIFNISSNLQKI